MPSPITATDNCDTDVIVEFDEVRTDGSCLDTYTLIRTWTATDNCDNSVSHTQVITVQDTKAPEWDQTMPVDVTVECDEVPEVPSPITATDNCDTDVIVEFDEVRTDGSCLDTYTLIRTWTATDNCDNSVSHTQVITVQDTKAPEWDQTMPVDVTVECDEVPEVPSPITATDNCDTDVLVELDEQRTDGSCLDTYTLTRTWTATDNCENSVSHTQVITVQDTKAPEILSTLCDVEQNKNTEQDQDGDHCTYTAGNEFDVSALDNCDLDVDLVWEIVDVNGTRTGTNETLNGEIFIPGSSIVTWSATDNCENFSTCSFNVVVTIPTTTEVYTSADATRFWDEITLYAVIDGACDGYDLTGNVQFFLDGIPVGPVVPANPIPYDEEGYLDGKLRATLIYKITSDEIKDKICNGGKVLFPVTAEFAADGDIYEDSYGKAETDLSIFRRKAVPFVANSGFYNGDLIGWITSNNSNTATITMVATLMDNSLPTGDLRNAKVTFCWVKDGLPNPYEPIPGAKDLPVGLVDQLDGTVGFASADVQINISKNSESESFDIAVLISGGYVGNNAYGNATITIARTLSDGSILGNGTVLNTESAGQIKGADVEDIPALNENNELIDENPMGVTSFNFNVQYNRKATNPQGYFNMTILSWYDSQGVLDNHLHTYFIKSNAINNFIVGPGSDLVLGEAIFEAKANIKELVETDVEGVYSWETVEGNSPIIVTMTDAEEDGGIDVDQIAITYYNSNGGIWFSNNWVTTAPPPHTEEQSIYNGVIDVKSSEAGSVTKPGKNKSGFITAELQLIELADLKVYPNPFDDRLRFEFVSPETTHAQLDVFDMTGRKVKTVFEGPVQGGVYNNAEFKPQTVISGMYIYRMTLGDTVYNGKAVYKKE